MDHTKFTLRLYGLVIDAVRLCRPMLDAIGRHDADLARQARRAITSIPLNVAEGLDATGGTRLLRFRTALGSTNEVIACVDCATALGYVDADAKAMDALQHVRAVLINFVKRKR